MTSYKRKISNYLIQEFDRLQQGGGDLKKRHDRFSEYINRIVEEPLNTDYIKDALDQYRAAPYKTGQYRIFLKS